MLSKLLPELQQDPTPVTNLIKILILPARYDFARVLSIQPPVDFIGGLDLASGTEVNQAVLGLLEKANYRRSDIEIVAGMENVIARLVTLWLITPSTAVATQAQNLLEAFLMADRIPANDRCMGQGLMWRRFLGDVKIYGSILSICCLSEPGYSKREKTIAQARLLDLLLKIDSEPVRVSQHRELESKYGCQNCGLLHFATCHMVQWADDVLMAVTLVDFYAKYLGTGRSRPSGDEDQGRSFALNFLHDNGLHTHAMRYYLESDDWDSVDVTFLYPSSANYISAYCSAYPQNLLSSPISDSILERLSAVLDDMSAAQWAQGKGPIHDLHVLVSLPRSMLLPGPYSNWEVLSLIPTKPANSDAIRALAHVFHGSEDSDQEKAAARALYFLYMEEFPETWEQIVAAANTVALKDIALAAISFIGAVISASWAILPDTIPPGRFPLPTEKSLTDKCHAQSLPKSGIEAVVTPPALKTVLPYLMKPAQTFSNLVGGGRGDVESAAYKIAVAKHDVLKLAHAKLQDLGWVSTHGDGRAIVAAVAKRVAQGPMAGTSEVGGRVGTMEL